MRVAVIGASGFIGRYVLAELAMRGIETVATSQSGAVRYAQSGQTISALDLAAPPDNPFELLGRPDIVVHLAWSGLPNYWNLAHFETELPRQYAFLAALVRGGLRNLVVSGTCFEYGMSNGPLIETQATLPSNPYGYAKDSLRRQLEFLRAESDLALTWTRIFYLFGEGQGVGSLYSQLCAAVAAGESIFPMSRGEQLRDFLNVAEAAQLIVALALNGRDNGIVNICSGSPISARTFVERLIAINGWNIVPELGRYPYPDYEPFAFWGDRKKLDWLTGRDNAR
jgi:nucleoside-diphosphate-sugar epimerase